jgi:hypothetical protein
MKTFTKKNCTFFFLLLSFNLTWSQSSLNRFLTPSDTLNRPRRNAVLITESVLFIGGVAKINNLFVKDQLNSNFHLHNDNSASLGMDKSAHIFVSYHIGSYSSNMLNWSGVSKKKQLIYGGGMGFVFLTTVELIDGFSQHGGTSYGDIIANGVGTTLFVSQELMWKEQRIIPKFSFKTADFISLSPGQMKSRITQEFDGQTFWLSVNMHSFFKDSKIPKWLNLAVGYGVEGVGSKETVFKSNAANQVGAYRQIYLSLDVDLTKIKTNSHFLKTVFYVFNSIKIPAPTIEYSSNEGFRGHFLYF